MVNDNLELYRYEKDKIKGWDALYRFYIENFTDKKNEWVFRGDNPDPKNPDISSIPANAFKSRLEKAFDDFESTDVNINRRRKIERRLIREFRRKVPIHTNYRQENWLECLGLMQHYEAPTRMLDWTYSFFAAVYFAINKPKERNCVVWALDSKWLGHKNEEFNDQFIKNAPNKKSLQKLRDDGRGGFENAIIHSWMPEPEEKQKSSSEEKEDPIIYVVNPYYLNERLSVQRGVLICPSDIDISWGENLASMLRKEGDGKEHLWRVRIEWEKVDIQKEILRRLYDMNISQASLFPDLDGLAKSLRTRVAMPETLRIFE